MALLFSFPPSSGRSQIRDLAFADHPSVAVYLALDLILEQARRFGQLAHDDKDGAGLGVLAYVGAKGDLLADRKFV